MTHRLQDSTRFVTLATCGGALVAAVDVLDQHGLSGWSVSVAVLLVLGALLTGRLHGVSLAVGDDVMVVRNLLTTRRIPTEEVAEVRPGAWRSRVVLTDGTELPTLLRDRDLATDHRHRLLAVAG